MYKKKKKFEESYKNFNLFKFPTDLGIGPLKLLLNNSLFNFINNNNNNNKKAVNYYFIL